MKSTVCSLIGCLALFFLSDMAAFAQQEDASLDRVLTKLPDKRGHDAIAVDAGSTGLWERLMKLHTVGSVMHTTAHPDDEHAGLLTYLGRGEGYRTSLLTLNRGEAGANAIGSELFDALGMIRTEELRLAAQYYGLDDQYFTSFADYGFSKTLNEALTNWGREKVLRDMVRVIRLNRPFVVISRFHGSERDGHGHHQAAGGITPEAVEAAGDPSRFAEDMRIDGTRPWKPFKLYRGGVREQETWHVMADPGAYDARLGESYQNFGYYGLSLQKSQTSGRFRESLGSSPMYYERLAAGAAGRESGFFDGIETSISGLFALFGESPAPGQREKLEQIEAQVEAAISAYDVARSESAVPALVEGLRSTRELLDSLDPQMESAFVLRIKERQFEDAIHTALGLQLSALAFPIDSPDSQSPWAPLPTMGVVVPGQTYKVSVTLLNPSSVAIDVKGVELESAAGLVSNPVAVTPGVLRDNQSSSFEFEVSVPENARYSRTYFSRVSINENQYQIGSNKERFMPRGNPAQESVVRYEVLGVELPLREIVWTRRANLPNGYELNQLKVAPRVAVNASPATRIVPLVRQPAVFDVDIEVLNNDANGVEGMLRLEIPDGWQITPASIPVSFDQAGQQKRYSFEVSAQGMTTRAYPVKAVLEADGKTYDEGYEIVDQERLGKHYLYRPAQVDVHGISVKMAEGLDVGYVMGVGDEVPAAIEQLGGTVKLLLAEDLESGDLSAFDVVVIGTRAYAVRQDLLRFNDRLIDYARDGGHLLILYQTPEYNPDLMAPFPAELPGSAEEISEEDAPVEILAPEHPVFHYPNEISVSDFDGWVEQRGSKFFASWDDAYLPLVVSNDTGQAPQKGGWLMADLGSGHFTYFAYAIHRQAPFAVAGALRIFANLLSYGSEPGR